jgi:hypothetical protein
MAAGTPIDEFGLSDVTELIHLQRKTGTLTVLDGNRRVTVAFLEGLVAGCEDTTHQVREVGDILVKEKKLTSVQFRAIQHAQEISGEHIVTAIERSGHVKPADIERVVTGHIKEIFMSLFLLKAGTYTFEVKTISLMPGLRAPLDTDEVMKEIQRRREEWPFLQQTVPNLTLVFGRTNLVPSGFDKRAEEFKDDQEGLNPGQGLSSEEGAVYCLVDGRRTVKLILEETPLSEFIVCRSLSSLVSAGYIVQGDTASEDTVTTLRVVRAHSKAPRGALLPAAALVLGALLTAGKLLLLWDSAEDAGQVFRVAQAHHVVATVGLGVQSFLLDRGKLPVEMGSLFRNGYLDEAKCRDPFTGGLITYVNKNLPLDIFSVGPDRIPGTTDDIR